MSFRFLVPSEKVPVVDGRSLLFVEGKTIALFNIASVFYAFEDSCPHQGASMWSGKLEGQILQCCAHGLRFDLATGYLLHSTQMKLSTYFVEVQGEQVFIVLNRGEQYEAL